MLDAQAYRRLADDVIATMPDPDRWDLDGAEEWVLAQYVQHLAAQLTLASELRVPLPEGLGGYGEIVVQRESTGSDRWAVTDGARVGLQAWIDGDGWKYVTDIGQAAAFAYELDEALELADEVARFEQERHDVGIAAQREVEPAELGSGEKDTRGDVPQQGESTHPGPRPGGLPVGSDIRAQRRSRIALFFRCARFGHDEAPSMRDSA